MAREEVTIYVDLEAQTDGWPLIKLYNSPEGRDRDRVDGAISVGLDGAIITFTRLPNKSHFWNFWNLTVHPLGKNEDVVDLDWSVADDQAVLRDTTSARKKRTFSYTLAFQLENGAKFYLDPRLVNTGGG